MKVERILKNVQKVKNTKNLVKIAKDINSIIEDEKEMTSLLQEKKNLSEDDQIYLEYLIERCVSDIPLSEESSLKLYTINLSIPIWDLPEGQNFIPMKLTEEKLMKVLKKHKVDTSGIVKLSPFPYLSADVYHRPYNEIASIFRNFAFDENCQIPVIDEESDLSLFVVPILIEELYESTLSEALFDLQSDENESFREDLTKEILGDQMEGIVINFDPFYESIEYKLFTDMSDIIEGSIEELEANNLKASFAHVVDNKDKIFIRFFEEGEMIVDIEYPYFSKKNRDLILDMIGEVFERNSFKLLEDKDGIKKFLNISHLH